MVFNPKPVEVFQQPVIVKTALQEKNHIQNPFKWGGHI